MLPIYTLTKMNVSYNEACYLPQLFILQIIFRRAENQPLLKPEVTIAFESLPISYRWEKKSRKVKKLKFTPHHMVDDRARTQPWSPCSQARISLYYTTIGVGAIILRAWFQSLLAYCCLNQINILLWVQLSLFIENEFHHSSEYIM